VKIHLYRCGHRNRPAAFDPGGKLPLPHGSDRLLIHPIAQASDHAYAVCAAIDADFGVEQNHAFDSEPPR